MQDSAIWLTSESLDIAYAHFNVKKYNGEIGIIADIPNKVNSFSSPTLRQVYSSLCL